MERPTTTQEGNGAEPQTEPGTRTATPDEQTFVTHRDIAPLHAYWKKFQEGVDGKPALKQQLEDTVSSTRTALDQAEEAAKRVQKLEADLIGGDGKDGVVKKLEGLVSQIQQAAEKVTADQEAIRQFHDELHGSADAQKTGIKQEIHDLKKGLHDLLEGQRRSHEVLHQQIEGLLPGAAAAGLAAGYHAQKVRHDRPIQVWSWVFSASMVAMAIYALFTFHEPTGFKQAIIQISSRIPFLLPVVWLAWHATKQQSQHKRIQQEYAHKESLATTYVGYSNEVEKLPDSPAKNTLREKLLNNILEMSAMNPSSTLEHVSHKDGPPIVDQVKGLAGEVQKIAALVKPGA